MKWLEIDMEDPAEKWDAFYREIEAVVLGSRPAPVPPGVGTGMLAFLHNAYWARGADEPAVDEALLPPPGSVAPGAR